MSLQHIIVRTLSLCVVVLGAGTVSGQDYPNKPVRILTGASGGGSDFVSRQIAQGISPALGQPVVVDNRPGAVLPIEAVAKSPADGYSLLVQGNRPEMKEKLLASGVEPVGSSPAEFAAIIKSESARLAQVVKDANIKID